MRIVNPYRVGETLKTVKEAMTPRRAGSRSSSPAPSASSKRQRGQAADLARLKAGGRV